MVAAVAATLLLGLGAAPALAWDARSIEGTPGERANTYTPWPPGGDQCSGAPDSVKGFYDFSWACYAHDVCYQNHQLNGLIRNRLDCDNIFQDKMYAECRFRHGWWSPARYACYDTANLYWTGARIKGGPAWESWNGSPVR